MTSFSEWEIEVFCPRCGEEWIVKGKRLTQSPEMPCPACGEIARVDVWSYHAQWARLAKMLGWK